ncbi:MAG: Holliday junction resolvase RuvX [Nitrospinae bacterium]|nr:Holliday junction resolvase RuvX [Nitrospinota bacterium]
MSHPRILGMDFGEKRVGLAISDSLGLTSQPLGLIERRSDEQLLDEMGGIIREHSVQLLLVGHPVGLSNRDTTRAKRTRKLVKFLRNNLEIPVETWDERLSTTQANRILNEMETKPSRKMKKRDVIAAQIILQAYLDHRNLKRSLSHD